jgi:hypothetical protein
MLCFTLPVLIPNQFELVKQISEDPKNLVVGLVRDKAATEKKVVAELGDRSNLHILHGDLTSYATLKQAAADTTKIVGERGIDYLVANGAFPSLFDAFDPIGALYVYSFIAAVRAGLPMINAKRILGATRSRSSRIFHRSYSKPMSLAIFTSSISSSLLSRKARSRKSSPFPAAMPISTSSIISRLR